MRIATFNLENLDLPLGKRGEILRPALERMDADILCLQEVNGQHVRGQSARALIALDLLLDGTRYASFNRAMTTAVAHAGAADVHNLVTLSSFPIVRQREIRHSHVPPLTAKLATAEPASDSPTQILFDRPILATELQVAGRTLHVFNVHLRAPLATAIPGGKLAPFTWKSASQWAEGFYLSAIKRAGQALELRLAIDAAMAGDPDALIAVAGDFNSADYETPLRIAVAGAEDHGNSALTERALVVLDRGIDSDRRYSILHHGRPQMVDHILVNHKLYAHMRAIEVHNETIGDEALDFARHMTAAGSYHAPLVATFAL